VIGTRIAEHCVYHFDMAHSMLGSARNEFTAPAASPARELFRVPLPGRTLWRWQQRNAAGDLVAHSEQLFPDYVACLCDSLRRIRS